MAVIALAGIPGAPGVTTTALALLLTWPLAEGQRLVLAECDPDGGAIAAGYLESRIPTEYGLHQMAAADRAGQLEDALWRQLIDLSPVQESNRLLLPGLPDFTQAGSLDYTWQRLGAVLSAAEGTGTHVLVDLGRSGACSPAAALVRAADVVAVVVRSTLRSLAAAGPRLEVLRRELAETGTDRLGLILIAEGPYTAREVTDHLGTPVWAVLPHEPGTARFFSDGGTPPGRSAGRAPLIRAARSAADTLVARAAEQRRRLAPPAAATTRE